ncbi:hypothetical protein ACFQZC_00450 [Streptacidiphilus monticola]
MLSGLTVMFSGTSPADQSNGARVLAAVTTGWGCSGPAAADA